MNTALILADGVMPDLRWKYRGSKLNLLAIIAL